jgi:hypothetical protein
MANGMLADAIRKPRTLCARVIGVPKSRGPRKERRNRLRADGDAARGAGTRVNYPISAFLPSPPPPPASPPSQSWPVSTSRNPLAQRWFRPLVSTVLLHTSTSLALNYIEGKDYYCSGTRAIRYSTLLKPVSFTTTSISSEDRNVFIVDWT